MNTNKRAADVIRALIIVTKIGRRLYSDKTKFGRSIKVTGWTDYSYETAKMALALYGYESKIVTKIRRMPRSQTKLRVTRLHVMNKAA